jgi:protein-disulfide isomerase
MKDNLERVASMVVMIATVVIAAMLAHREFVRPSASVPSGPVQSLAFDSAWRTLLPVGIELGDVRAPVKLIVFADLECPFCREFHSVARRIEQHFPGRVSEVFVHYPLSMHRFAKLMARGAECASQERRTSAFIDVAFAKQDSLGLISWASYAEQAGVSDTLAFLGCIRDTVSIARINEGLSAGDALAVRGTPTVIVNGWRFSTPPTESTLVAVITELLDGKAPRLAAGGK